MPVWYFYNSQTLLRGRNVDEEWKMNQSVEEASYEICGNDKRIMELLFSLCGPNIKKNVSLTVWVRLFTLSMVARGDDGYLRGSTAGGPHFR